MSTAFDTAGRPEIWLSVIGLGFIATHLILIAQRGGLGHLGTSILGWLVVMHLVWRSRSRLVFQSSIGAKLLGSVLLGFTLVLSLMSSYSSNDFLRVSPLLCGLGMALIASGFRDIWCYRVELLVLFFVGVPRLLLPSLIDICPITAQAAGFLLHYLGRDVVVEGLRVCVSGGCVNVGPGCDGMEAMTQLLSLAVLFLAVFPAARTRIILVVVVAVTAGFLANTLRVALLAILAASSDRSVFEFWHGGHGAVVWMILPVVAFACFCLLLLSEKQRTRQKIHRPPAE